jgi:hypothetical protein
MAMVFNPLKSVRFVPGATRARWQVLCFKNIASALEFGFRKPKAYR